MSYQRHTPLLGCGVVYLAVCALVGAAMAEPAADSKRQQGEVAGNNVYVRSGPSLNHYPVCKLNAGDRVTILGEQGEWYEIAPPDETFSWISAQYVDSVDDRDGVVNGDNVRVRAGSSLPKWAKSKYVVQTMLGKGTEVSIVGKNPDGFLKVAPPAGATLWINRQFVVEASGSDATVAQSANVPAESTLEAVDTPDPDGVGVARTSPFHSFAMTGQRKQLEEIDAAAKVEADKPMFERRFAPLMARYQKVAEQEEDDLARRYAQTRVAQLAQMGEMIDVVRKMQKIGDETDAKRRALLEERLKMPTVTIPTPSGLDAQGELRLSALYPKGSHPRRYRLVDPGSPNGRTIGYVEIAPDSSINVGDFLGRYVGVRASQRRFQTGGVDAIPVYLADELVILETPWGEATKGHSDGATE